MQRYFNNNYWLCIFLYLTWNRHSFSFLTENYQGCSLLTYRVSHIEMVGTKWLYELRCLVASVGFSFCVSSTSFSKKYHRLALTASDRKYLRYKLKVEFLITSFTKRDSYWSFWCQGWSNHQDEENFWGNRAVEAVEASEVAEADEVNEAAEVSKGSKITTEDFRVI